MRTEGKAEELSGEGSIAGAKQRPCLLIPAMTADVYEEDFKETKEAGMDGHLAKPLDARQIVAMLAKYRTIG